MATITTRRTAGELLLETAVLEQQTANLISALRDQHARSPSLELEQKIERLETEHADALERLFELQRAVEPQPPRADRLVGERAGGVGRKR